MIRGLLGVSIGCKNEELLEFLFDEYIRFDLIGSAIMCSIKEGDITKISFLCEKFSKFINFIRVTDFACKFYALECNTTDIAKKEDIMNILLIK